MQYAWKGRGTGSCKRANKVRGLHIWAGRGRGGCISRALAEIEEKLEEKDISSQCSILKMFMTPYSEI